MDFSSDLFTLIHHFVFPNSPPRAAGAEAVPEESRKKTLNVIVNGFVDKVQIGLHHGKTVHGTVKPVG